MATFDGVWTSISPPGYQIVFTKIGGGLRQANLPVLGATTVTVSDGRDASNLKVSGVGFDCFFLFAATAVDEMTWTLKSGPSSCPPTALFKRVPTSTNVPKGSELTGIRILYFRKSADGNSVMTALENRGISYELVNSRLPDNFKTDTINCGPSVSAEAIKKVAIALMDQNVLLHEIRPFQNENANRIELIATQTAGEAPITAPFLSRAQIASLTGCQRLTNAKMLSYERPTEYVVIDGARRGPAWISVWDRKEHYGNSAVPAADLACQRAGYHSVVRFSYRKTIGADEWSVHLADKTYCHGTLCPSFDRLECQ